MKKLLLKMFDIRVFEHKLLNDNDIDTYVDEIVIVPNEKMPFFAYLSAFITICGWIATITVCVFAIMGKVDFAYLLLCVVIDIVLYLVTYAIMFEYVTSTQKFKELQEKSREQQKIASNNCAKYSKEKKLKQMKEFVNMFIEEYGIENINDLFKKG